MDIDLQFGSTLGRVQKLLEQIANNPSINAFITVDNDRVHSRAKESDERRLQGKLRSPIDGIPIAIKDNFCTKDLLTTAGSQILSNFIPPYESSVTQALIDNGAIVIGKTNMDEFGMGSSTENSHFGPTLNPVGIASGAHNFVPGGSSGGSAAAVAAGYCPVAIGTDTGGSVRQPASFCGLVGFKPTYGSCSRYGMIAYASSLDQAGVICRRIEEVATLLDVIVLHDEKDSTSLEHPTAGKFERIVQKGLANKKKLLGIPIEFKDHFNSSEELQQSWSEIEKTIRKAKYQIEYITLPSIRYCLAAYYVIALSEASSNLARYDGVRFGIRANESNSIEELYKKSRSEGFGSEVKRRILLGTFFLSHGYYDAYYLKAQKIRSIISNEFQTALSKCDALIWPTTPTSAFEFGKYQKNSAEMYMQDIFTVPVNLAGLPAVTLPLCLSNKNGMPLGVSLIGGIQDDAFLLQIAQEIENVL